MNGYRKDISLSEPKETCEIFLFDEERVKRAQDMMLDDDDGVASLRHLPTEIDARRSRTNDQDVTLSLHNRGGSYQHPRRDVHATGRGSSPTLGFRRILAAVPR